VSKKSAARGANAAGHLRVELADESKFLGPTLDVEVRDSGLRLVAKESGPVEMDLPGGVYEVSAVLGDGRRHSNLVTVSPGEETPVQFGSADAIAAMDTLELAARSGQLSASTPGEQRVRVTRSMTIEGETSAGDIEAEVQLLEVDGASVVSQTPSLITLECLPRIEHVATALLRVGPRSVRISLPISPQTLSPSGRCVVQVSSTSQGPRAHAWISPERVVANGLQNLLSSGYVIEAARVADSARDLLQGKYQDPTGAALGALLLNKVGRLAEYVPWLENLARDFPWLPDGKILLAHVHADGGEPSTEDLELAIEAAGQRILFAETYSLLLDLLRRWPGHSSDRAQRAAAELGEEAPFVDREAICLATWLPSAAD
jgi:hypothetical protein